MSTERAGAERRIVEGLLQLFAKHDIKATWAVVGHLFLGECRREGGVVHPEIVRPGYRWLDRDWFDPDPVADLATEPMWYGTDIVDMIKNATPTQEIGSHSFSHLIVGDPDCSEEAFRSDLVACREVARETGVELRSFVYPRNTIGHLDVLPEQGFRAYRGLRPAAFADRGNGVRRLMRALDKVTPQEHIRYDLYLNGQFDGATVDPYPHQFTMYLTLGIVNTIEVYAVDEAGNRSAPATMTIDLRTP